MVRYGGLVSVVASVKLSLFCVSICMIGTSSKDFHFLVKGCFTLNNDRQLLKISSKFEPVSTSGFKTGLNRVFSATGRPNAAVVAN